MPGDRKIALVEGVEYDLTDLAAAVEVWDVEDVENNKLWGSTQNDADVQAAVAADEASLDKVREAFYEVTKAYNTRANCGLVGITFMRGMLRLLDKEE